MKLRSTRICKPRAPLRLQSNSNQTILGPCRRSSRLQLRQRSPSQLVRATSYTRVPTSTPIEVSALVLSRTQFQDFGPQLQRNNVIYTALDARAPDDVADVREFLDRTRESEPPGHLAYKQYLVNTEGLNNELTVEISAYPLIAKRTSAEQEISGYMQSVNYAWSEVDNRLTTSLSDAKPDIFESYSMPAYAVEFKGCDGSIAEAQLQYAYDRALMTEGAHAMHTHIDNDNPRDSFENFQNAYKYTRNAYDIGYKWVTKRKDALWAYTNRDNTQTSPDVATSVQQLTDSLIPVSSGPPDGYNYDAYDDEAGPTDQLLRESWTDNRYASPDAEIYNPITPPQSSKDASVSLESQQLSVATVTEPGENVDLNAHGQRKTRARTRHAVAVEGPREVDHKPKPRKARMKQYIS
ncbi:hypothetical protein BKA64DRAFT_720342 [Cadophora sp. MPI-SDFR-AT-0126]|nr:hypothetical protein BKA64DRAFT_720342 [Leotiomycetes sp. MPI-SDFR-AT-0126]